jgi:hypothetical protein
MNGRAHSRLTPAQTTCHLTPGPLHRLNMPYVLSLISLLFAVALPTADPALLKTLDGWLRAYHSGKVDLISQDDISRTSIAKANDVFPRHDRAKLTARRELEVLLALTVAADDADAAHRLLQFAAVGLDQGRYTAAMTPHTVRSMGQAALSRLKSPAARELVSKAARGEAGRLAASRDQERAVLAAALRMAGAFGDQGTRVAMEANLFAPEPVVRIGAADGLSSLKQRTSIDILARALEQEKSDLVLLAIIDALDATMAAHPEATDAARLAVQAAIQALGRAGWRSDLALVQLLERFRTAESVPALIAVLQRFSDNPEEVRAGRLSRVLLHRAHEVLVSLTGAYFAPDEAEKWAEFYDREKEHFKVAEVKSDQKASGTVAKGFFGIPVQGSRVVFVVDISGSMQLNMGAVVTSASELPDKLPIRLDVAKRELLSAVDQLAEVAQFNCVVFGSTVSVWSKDLVPATTANKARFRKYVEGLIAQGATNLWGGMSEGLKLKSQVYGARYETNVDELFILSDGLPTTGEVTNPQDILTQVAETNRFARVRINTVYIAGSRDEQGGPAGVGAGPRMGGAELMRRLATENGGRFIETR